MSSLQETLEALSNSLPEIPGHLEELVADGKEVDQAAIDFLDHVAKKCDEAAEHLSHLKQAIAEIAAEADADEAQLKANGDGAESTVDQLVSGLDTQGEAIDERSKAATEAMDGLDQALTEAAKDVHDSEQELRQAQEGLGKVLTDGQGEVSNAMEAALSGIKELDTALDEAKGVVAEGGDNLVKAVEGFVSHYAERLDALRGAFETLCGNLTEAVESAQSEVEKGAKTAEDSFRVAIEDEFTTATDAATTEVGAALAGLGQALAQAQADAETLKDTLEQRVSELRDVEQPLPEGIVKVKQAAETLGLCWS